MNKGQLMGITRMGKLVKNKLMKFCDSKQLNLDILFLGDFLEHW